MKALILADEKEKIKIENVPKPELLENQVLVKVKAAALNRRDQWCREGKYPNIKYGSILGSDGAGEVVEAFDGRHKDWIGKEVVINPNINWGSNPLVQSKDYRILGMPDNGTFAEYIAVGHDRLQLKPEHLSFTEAAALPLGGLTAYRAVFTHGKVKEGMNVLITGIGGGVSQFCALFCMHLGAKVYITSGDDNKIDAAIESGAVDGFNYKDEYWIKKARNVGKGFDLAIDSAGGNQFNNLINLVNPGGLIVFYGTTLGAPEKINLHKVFWNQIKIQGSTMGNDQEFEEMLAFVNETKFIPGISSVRPFEEIVSAFDEMKAGEQYGKLVVEM